MSGIHDNSSCGALQRSSSRDFIGDHAPASGAPCYGESGLADNSRRRQITRLTKERPFSISETPIEIDRIYVCHEGGCAATTPRPSFIQDRQMRRHLRRRHNIRVGPSELLKYCLFSHGRNLATDPLLLADERTRPLNFSDRLVTIALHSNRATALPATSLPFQGYDQLERAECPSLSVKRNMVPRDVISAMLSERDRAASKQSPGYNSNRLNNFINDLESSATGYANLSKAETSLQHYLEFNKQQTTADSSKRLSRPLVTEPFILEQHGCSKEPSSSSTSSAKLLEADEQDMLTLPQRNDAKCNTAGWTSCIPLSTQRLLLSDLLYTFHNHDRTSFPMEAYTSSVHTSGCTDPDAEAAPAQTASGPRRGFVKRKHCDDEDDNNDKRDGEDRRPGQSHALASENADGPLLACPFYKRHPLDNLDCQQKVLRKICHVKQHIRRRHLIPIHCTSCYATFDTEEERDAHMRQRPACDVKPPIVWNEAITQRKYEAINKRSDQKKSVEDQWFAIFSVLFSNCPLPTSVYRDCLQSPQLIKVQEDIYHEWPAIIDSLATELVPEELRQHAIILGPHLNTICQHLITSVLRRLKPATGLEYASATSDSGFNSQSRVINVSNPQPIPPQAETDNSNSFSYVGGGIEAMGYEAIMPWQYWQSLFTSNEDFLRSHPHSFNGDADTTGEKE